MGQVGMMIKLLCVLLSLNKKLICGVANFAQEMIELCHGKLSLKHPLSLLVAQGEHCDFKYILD